MKNWPVYDILKEAAHQWPNNPAVHDGYGTLSFKQLFIETEELRNQLLKMGIKEGMGIGVIAANGRNFIIGIFAAVGCGAAVMPMSPLLKQPEVDDILKDARLHAIIDDCSGIQPLDTIETVIPLKNGSFRFGFTGIHESVA